MIIKFEKGKFNSLSITDVGHACFEPMLPIYREFMRHRQDEQTGRAEFFQLLSKGQKALFIFFTYYDHAIRSEDEFLRISRLYLSSQIFEAVKKGTAYFNALDMFGLLTETEELLSGNEQTKISELYLRFCEISPDTLSIIGSFIKENPGCLDLETTSAEDFTD